jgi:MORN repeat variant
MKNLILTFVLFASTLIFAQNIEPKLEIVGQQVKATYFHDNGTIQQEGFFADGKLNGKWTSYDVNGKIIAIAEYLNGSKTGKWINYNNNVSINEVLYSNNNIVSSKILNVNAIASKN